MKNVRCAIYTRKSSEEGLEQGFNSLDAQREACAAYILSQASEGWIAVDCSYDDGGVSGGTLARPGLRQLLADVAAGQIDIIVVYKVDRLTRSLLDFSKLVEMFDKANVSFVSITQSFNTTTSMGRLTLNMLLSFAQFEREVTAERIRDKIAASKAKGMWMGGVPPLGYRPDGRSLAIVEAHAEIVRQIYRRYLDLGNVRLLAQALDREGVHAPKRLTASGKAFGGRPFSRGQLYLMLKCRTYIGEVQHRHAIYPGLHDPIIDHDLWTRVQTQLADNVRGQRSGRNSQHPSLLAGRIVDDEGNVLIVAHTMKKAVRYRYYISRALQTGDSRDGMRIPAREIEGAVAERIARAFDDPLTLATDASLPIAIADFAGLKERAATAAAALRRRDHATIQQIVAKVALYRSRVEIQCYTAQITHMLAIETEEDLPATLTLTVDMRLKRSGRAMRYIYDKGPNLVQNVNTSLIRLIVQAHRYWHMLCTEQINMTQLAERENLNRSWVIAVLRLAFLSPQITNAIFAGTHNAKLNGKALRIANAVDLRWSIQEKTFCRNS